MGSSELIPLEKVVPMSYKCKTFVKGDWSLEVEVDGDESQAYLEHVPSGDCASLSMVQDCGVVNGEDFDAERTVPATVQAWADAKAEAYGY